MPAKRYEIIYTDDIDKLRKDLNRILSDIGNRLNYMKPAGDAPPSIDDPSATAASNNTALLALLAELRVQGIIST